MNNKKVLENNSNDLDTKENDILVSIIVPIYNIELYLPQCIESICNQSYSNIEIILVDDASTDSSGKICDDYARKDNRIQVIHKSSNEGLVAARKTGMRIANGEVIGNVDGDDWIEPDMFKMLVERYTMDDSDIVQSGYIEDGGKNIIHTSPNFTKKLTGCDCNNLIERWMSGKEILVDSQIFTKLYRRIFYEKCYEKVPNKNSFGEDMIFFLYSMKEASKISSIDQCYYHYRVRDDSLSHKKDGINLLLKEDNLMYHIKQLIRNLYPQISDKVVENWALRKKFMLLRTELLQYDFYIPLYKFDNIKDLYGKKVIIYGAGAVGRDYIMQISDYEQIDIVMWVDKNPNQYNYPFRKVNHIEAIRGSNFDYIIIAVRNEMTANQIRKELISRFNIDDNCILWNCG